jgi:hypothetical protein
MLAPASYRPPPVRTSGSEPTLCKHVCHPLAIGCRDFTPHGKPFELGLLSRPCEKAVEKLGRPTLETVSRRDENVSEVELTRMPPELQDPNDLTTVPTQEVEIRFPVGATEVGSVRVESPE